MRECAGQDKGEALARSVRPLRRFGSWIPTAGVCLVEKYKPPAHLAQKVGVIGSRPQHPGSSPADLFGQLYLRESYFAQGRSGVA